MKEIKNKKKEFIFQIGKLMNQNQGYSEQYEFNEDLELDDPEISPVSKFSGEVTFIKIDEESLHAEIRDLKVKLDVVCTRCLKHFILTFRIPLMERQFYSKKPPEIDDLRDLYMIKTRSQEVDLIEMIRQEIILHFPDIPVCSSHCKGLCSQCGKDLNEKKCGCKPLKVDEEASHKPLAQLKNLIKP